MQFFLSGKKWKTDVTYLIVTAEVTRLAAPACMWIFSQGHCHSAGVSVSAIRTVLLYNQHSVGVAVNYWLKYLLLSAVWR